MLRAKAEKKIYRWKNKIVSEKVYNHRLKQIENGKKRKIKDEEEVCEGIPEGIRLVDFKVMVKNLYCIKCKENLYLHNCEREIRRGLGSFLMIRCETCLYLNSVPTSRFQNATEDRQSMFDINARCALGAIYSGLECSQLNKFLAVLNHPPLSQAIYQRHERIVGTAAEAVAKESCLAAAKEELSDINMRIEKATIKKRNVDTLKPLQSILSDGMIDRLAGANISFDLIIDTYCNEGWEKTKDLLQHKVNKIPQVIKRPSMLDDIHDFLCVLVSEST